MSETIHSTVFILGIANVNRTGVQLARGSIFGENVAFAAVFDYLAAMPPGAQARRGGRGIFEKGAPQS